MSAGWERALNITCKWRNLLAGWQLGTRAGTDAEFRAVRDHREITIILRVEVTALTDLLLRKGLITQEEFQSALEREAIALDKDYAARWPGVRATENGLAYDFKRIERAGWMKGWRP